MSHIILAKPDSAPSSSAIIPTSGPNPPTISYSFQIQIASLGTADAADSISIASNSSLASRTAFYRSAELTDLRAIIHPTGIAPAYPTTVSLLWCPSNSTASTSDILNVYGGQMFCIGGALQSTTPIEVPCDLTQVNPMIKSSVTYNDTPKLIYSSTAQATAPTSATCKLTITGTVRLHSPLLQASSS